MSAENIRLQTPWHFIPIQKDIMDDETITVYERAVFVTLNYYANWSDGTCFPTYQVIAKKTGVSKNTAIRAIKGLEQKGYISISPRYSKEGDRDSNLITILNYRTTNTSVKQNTPPSQGRPVFPEKADGLPSQERPVYPDRDPNKMLLLNEMLSSEMLKDTCNFEETTSTHKNTEEKKILSEFNRIFTGVYKRDLRPTRERLKQITTRLKTFTAVELIEAARNLRSSPFHAGENDRNWCATPEFLYRNDTQVDKWLNYQQHQTPTKGANNNGFHKNYQFTDQDKRGLDIVNRMLREQSQE